MKTLIRVSDSLFYLSCIGICTVLAFLIYLLGIEILKDNTSNPTYTKVLEIMEIDIDFSDMNFPN
jgi:hypothetical protein